MNRLLIPCVLAVAAVMSPLTAASTPGSASEAGRPSDVQVTIAASACRVAPARVVSGAVRLTIRNRTRVPQRFTIAGKTSAPVPPGGQVRYQVALDNPAVYGYSCKPTRGIERRGRLRVARNVIVESDMDASAAMAILYILNREDVEVTAIVVDGDGEARCPAGASNALSLAALAGKPNIPVGCGRPQPLQGTHAFPSAWRDYTDGFYGLKRPAAPARAPAGSGEQVYRAAIQSAPGRVDVVTDGPPTELAALLTTSRALTSRIRSVTMMGGALRVPGNIAVPGITNAHAEWNLFIDARAANVVFRSGVPVTLVPLDATNTVPLNPAVAARLGTSPSAAFVRSLMTSLLPATSGDSTRFFFWDPLTSAVLVEPAVGTYVVKKLAVVEDEGSERGRVVEVTDGARVRVTTSAGRARFETSFISTLG